MTVLPEKKEFFEIFFGKTYKNALQLSVYGEGQKRRQVFSEKNHGRCIFWLWNY